MRTTTTRRRVAALLLALALPAGTAACGTTDRAQTESQGGSTTEQDQDGSTPQASTSGSDASADPSAGPSADQGADQGATDEPDTVLATVQGEHEKTPLEEDVRIALRLDLTALERIDGDAVEVRFRLTNLSDQTWEPYAALGDSGFGEFGASEVVLLDLPGDRRYLTLRDSEENCLCSTWGGSELQLPAGDEHDFYARFPAPPEDVTTIEVQVPNFPPVPGVEISS